MSSNRQKAMENKLFDRTRNGRLLQIVSWSQLKVIEFSWSFHRLWCSRVISSACIPKPSKMGFSMRATFFQSINFRQLSEFRKQSATKKIPSVCKLIS